MDRDGTILDLIGRTPLVKLTRINPNPAVTVYIKAEFMNPGGSVKDRIALSMIETAEESGELTKDKIILEASSGNTAIGLAMVCAVKGYSLAVTMSESASEERKKILRAYGAELILTPGHLATDGAIEEAYRLAREEPAKYILLDQYNNDSNWQAHFEGTAQEIWDATDGKVSAVTITMGTTGTLMGITRRLKQLNPEIRVIGVEPFVGHKIQGLKNMKESYPPGIFAPDEPARIVNVEDDAAYECARQLARREGILIGMSSGAAVRIALDEAEKMDHGTVVAIVPDSGERYLSTSLFVSEVVYEPLHFFNTLSKTTEELKPVRPGKIGIYACGPSLDGPVDVGLCRRMVFTDVLRRYFVYRGFEVKLVTNLGDIDDRTVNECLRHGADLKEFTTEWESKFHDAMKSLNVLPANQYPRASEHINEMIDQTRLLLDRGMAYEKLRSVYFKINKLQNYGQLSGFDVTKMQKTSSTDYDYYDKENPGDFALFKRASLAELKAGIYWNTPWGNGRPGWHIECACLASKHLGGQFDIHTAGTDLIFPHGDNEIAIAQATGQNSLANIWLHCDVVMAGGKKISRFGGNVLTLDDLDTNGHNLRTIRFWLLATHYRKVLKYSETTLTQAREAVARLNRFVFRLSMVTPTTHNSELDQVIYHYRSRYHAAMDHDLNVPQALGAVFSFIRKANPLVSTNALSKSQTEKILDFMRGLNDVLAVIDFPSLETTESIRDILARRDEARKNRDYAKADALREELADRGIEVFDTPNGSFWQPGEFAHSQ